ncbi:XRE family transcriptional regulator [Streptomyces canus]|uniref:XRE family transcriptional regulator n=1 Tax=Streptomyces canus TaxID=58343 RepID=A0A101RJU4_9ACTN|nr:XRE family transcriptional regulator [Streptomyces canus]
MSSDYYQRMEQGRDVRPSEQVLDALSRALNFSAEESRHLHSLATAARTPSRLPRSYEPEEVPDTTLRLLHTMTSPALVVGRFLDVLAWNPLGGVLLEEFTRQPQSERNMLALFLRPEADRACPNRAATVAELIGMLRSQVAADPGHPRAVELVGELAVRNDEFAALWALHDVEEPTRGQMRLTHPQVGELNLDWDAYPIPGNPGPALMVCTTAEGSPDAERLQRLADLLGTTP